jgi:CO/xanthine dehydrogenase Mo-binding subunit
VGGDKDVCGNWGFAVLEEMVQDEDGAIEDEERERYAGLQPSDAPRKEMALDLNIFCINCK